ncbi:BamA/TamA family outer membrane protein [Rubritalea spongiae]|uniref:BamA/TamA family outer membrane protein n=1 Tax=Rubritalea spongiae TaxID=430797 RepID=A0ABW5E5T6_9BACT
MFRIFSTLLISSSLLVAQDFTKEVAKNDDVSFIDPSDGYFDVSSFLDHPYGFIPIVNPITEPAIGEGLALIPMFVSRPEGQHRPNFTALGAMKTNNGTKGFFGGYSGYFFDEQLRITAGATSTSLNLDFYGFGAYDLLDGRSLHYNLDIVGGLLGAEWRIKDSKWYIGARYLYGEVDAQLQNQHDFHLLPNGTFLRGIGRQDTLSSILFELTHDTRDNVFTPLDGHFAELSLLWNDELIGATESFQRLTTSYYFYQPIVENTLFFGIKSEAKHNMGDSPFYALPSVQLRGAPRTRYQGTTVAYSESELRWQFHPRWSVLGFGGVGASWGKNSQFDDANTTFTGGTGLRYLLAKDHSMHVGVDLAYGEEGPAVYIQFGSAWSRP